MIHIRRDIIQAPKSWLLSSIFEEIVKGVKILGFEAVSIKFV